MSDEPQSQPQGLSDNPPAPEHSAGFSAPRSPEKSLWQKFADLVVEVKQLRLRVDYLESLVAKENPVPVYPHGVNAPVTPDAPQASPAKASKGGKSKAAKADPTPTPTPEPPVAFDNRVSRVD